LFTSGIFSKIPELTRILGLLFPNLPVVYLFDLKWVCATFLRTFSKTYLVTLAGSGAGLPVGVFSTKEYKFG
jgi:hypothetical protein